MAISAVSFRESRLHGCTEDTNSQSLFWKQIPPTALTRSSCWLSYSLYCPTPAADAAYQSMSLGTCVSVPKWLERAVKLEVIESQETPGMLSWQGSSLKVAHQPMSCWMPCAICKSEPLARERPGCHYNLKSFCGAEKCQQAVTNNGKVWHRHKEAVVFCLSWLSVVLGCSVLLSKAVLEFFCLPWKLKTCEVQCLCQNKRLPGCCVKSWDADMQQGEGWHWAQTGSQGESSGEADVFVLITWFPPAGVIDTQVVQWLNLRVFVAAGFQLQGAVGGTEGRGGVWEAFLTQEPQRHFHAWHSFPKVAPLILETVWHLKPWAVWPWVIYSCKIRSRRLIFFRWEC